ncbi:MAG: endopeptidase IV [Tatlockia sp.]|jgi:enhanced entry protein EnhC
MKSFAPWVYLIAATGSQLVFADGLEAYRKGDYSSAAIALVSQSGKDPVADYYIGRMRLYGYGQLKNNSSALRSFTQAAEKGVLPAQQLLARYYLLEEHDPEKALSWFKLSAEKDDVGAQMYTAAAYLFGFGTKKNEDIARKYFIEAAKNGNAIAQFTLASHFLGARDLNSKKLGVIWLTKAAAQEDTNAMAALGELYANGTVVPKDYDKAVELLTKAASQNASDAMRVLGELAIKQNQLDTGKQWLEKAGNAQNLRAKLELADLYLDPKSPLFNVQTGFMLTLEAAQGDSIEAQHALALLYKDGKGVAQNTQLAEQWELKAKESALNKPSNLSAMQQVAHWLSNGKENDFSNDTYRLKGIFSPWQNPAALKQNNYNPAPKMEFVTRAELYKPNFTMVHPREIPINEYFDLIAPTLNAGKSASWSFLRYPLDKQIEAIQQGNSTTSQSSIPNAGGGTASPEPSKPVDAQQKANYQSVLSKLYGEAILGNSTAQFEIGQLYQYGIAVAKNPQQALTYYQLAAAQQEIRAEYNLGILYLEGETNPVNYKQGLVWLTDAAFKGNVYAQYALANMYEKGFTDKEGKEIVSVDPQQALAMYYLASSNNFGPAQYSLAEYLVKQKELNLSVAAKEKRTPLIRSLYQGAVDQGINEAQLPLAYYNAMDKAHPEKQALALQVAKSEASKGNSEAALLVGMMYEKGLAIPANAGEALYWYQQAATNPVNAFILGTLYSQGLGLTKDLDRGRILLQQAAEAGFSYASLNLAVLKQQKGEDFISELNKAREEGNSMAGLLLADYYLASASDSENIQQARDIYQFFADKGDKEAQVKLGFLFDNGIGGQENRDMAAKWYALSAEQGQPVAQFLLGQMYQLAKIGKEPDYITAKKWYKAAKAVNPKAAIALGFIYDTVEDNYEKALENYQLAAKMDNATGEYDLALMYSLGKGLALDYHKAFDLLTQAADQIQSEAMTQLANLYFSGFGTARDQQKALDLYKKSADLGDAAALYQLGLLSETGVAAKLDYPSAVNYYTKAAEKGNEKAKLALARMYQYGLGVNQDSAEAKRLYDELSANNNAYAQYQLALMLYNGAPEHRSEEGKRLLQQASDNGSLQARKMLQWLDSQQQDRVSFIEPFKFNQTLNAVGQETADLMYFDALSEWNRGDVDLSRTILKRLMTQYPQFTPAKRAYEQLSRPDTTFSVVYNEMKKS